MSITESGINSSNVTNNNNATVNINSHNTTIMTNTNGMSNVILHNGSSASATMNTSVLSPHLDDQNPLSLKINELKQQQQQQYHNSNNNINNNQYENSLPRPDSIAASVNLANTSSKESSRFRIIKTDSDGKNVLDSTSKQHSPHINGPSGDSSKTYGLNGSIGPVTSSSSNIGSQSASTMAFMMNNLNNGSVEYSSLQRSNSVSQQSNIASNCNNYQRGRWYVADFGAQQQQQHCHQHEPEQINNVDQSSLNIIKLPLNQNQTHFNPIESTSSLNQQQTFQSINNSLTLIQPTPTTTNKINTNTTTANIASQPSLLNTTNNENANNNIPQQMHQSLVSNSSNSLSSPIQQQQQHQQQQLQQMPIATQSMTKTSPNLTLDAQQNPVINLSQKTVLIENSYNTNEPQTFQQQTQLQNTIDSNLIEKPQIYQQTHDNVPSVLPVTTSNTTSTNISQQSFDSLNLNVSNVNTNLPSNLNQISPKDNQMTSQSNSTTINTSNNANNNNINTTSNNSNLIQSSPSSTSTIAGLTSIQSNSTLTTSMATISNLDHGGANTSPQINSTTGADSINDIVDNLNVEQKSSSDSGIHSRIELAMDLVKSHLTLAVKEEIVALKNQIKQLNEVCTRLEQENQILKQHATPETLLLIENRNNTNAAVSSNNNNNNTINASNPSNINNQSNDSNGVNSNGTIVSLAGSNQNQTVNSVDSRNIIPPPVNQDSMISSFTENFLTNNGDILTNNPSKNNNNNNNPASSIAQNTNELN